MSKIKNVAIAESDPAPARSTPRLPPCLRVPETRSAEEAVARMQARESKDARIRGIISVREMREAIKRVGRGLPDMPAVERIGLLNAAAFRTRAARGLPFIMTGLVERWPLMALTVQTLRDRFGVMPVRARTGDYVGTAFAPDRAMQDMSMRDYLDLIAGAAHGLPPYLGNLELRELNSLCHWPGYFEKMGPPRFWLGPSGTITPLHCDFDDNIFAQVWGSKRVILSPPHHDEFLYTSEANALLLRSPFNPEAPDFARFPLARHASMIESVIRSGELLYLPAGWYHQVRSLTLSLSANRWARGLPFALSDERSLRCL